MFPITEAWNGYEIDDAVLKEYDEEVRSAKKDDDENGILDHIDPDHIHKDRDVVQNSIHVGKRLMSNFI